MSASRLRLNSSKTQVLWLGSRHNINRLIVHDVPVLSSTVVVVGSASDLGVVTDSWLSMADHVASVCRSAYYHLRQIRATLQSLSRDTAKTLVQAFISSRLDHCNLVLYGITDNLLQQLQSVQNAATRLITRTGRLEHKSGAITCVIPWSRTRLGDRLFDVTGPRLWNKLPASLRLSDSLCQFRRQLKTFLFVKD